ncbi:serine/threonine protein kinase [Mycolicibacterium sp.]|uniref:serine/threonine protein kinase n=1 Tax=Mycolicibacterium sp. TaxID=2320850 RepID=UPI001A23C637|nr:serine/threonine protein kinase [Mycolicibacterium sp.]MBJ7336059.1 protein kinase [Mycolicibacterium sp.]
MQFEQIAGYTVIHQLGAGGMGQVFLVKHPRLPRRDAMKLLDSGVSRNDEFRTRFRREADMLAQLSHPNIVTLFDRGEFDGRLWITMEYVDGTDAAALSKTGGPLQVPLAIALIDGAGAALDYAWRKQRITHRDVKPANILVALDGDGGIEAVKLADFGIAKAAGESTSLTSTGITVGTVAYLSPEAIEGHDLDTRADLYSLGCSAFQLLTGTPPFTGTTIAALMSAHLTRPVPDVTDRVPALPVRLNAVFAKVLAKDPDARYQSCSEFVADLRAATGEPSAGGASGITAATAPTLSAPTMVRPSAPQPRAVTDGSSAGKPHSSRRGLLIGTLTAAVAALVAVIGFSLRVHVGDTGRQPATSTSVSTVQSAKNPTVSATAAPPETLSATDSSPPSVPPAATSTASQYPPAGALGTYCSDPGAIGVGPGGAEYYCERVQYTDGYKWSLTPEVIPNALPDKSVDPLCWAGSMGAVAPCGGDFGDGNGRLTPAEQQQQCSLITQEAPATRPDWYVSTCVGR